MLQADSFFQSIEPYLISIIIIVASTIAAWLVNMLIKHYLRKREGAKSSKTINIVLKNIRSLYILVFIVGVYLGYKILPFVTAESFAIYNQWIETTFFIILVFLICYVTVRVIMIFIDRYYIEIREEEKTPGIIMKLIGPIVFLVGLLIIL